MGRLAVFSSLALLVWGAPGEAQTGAQVLVVGNQASQASTRIVEHYARSRDVPQAQILMLADLAADPPDAIDRGGFERHIQAPVAKWLAANSAQDRIHYIVLTKGVPLRVNGTSGLTGTTASVDSELTLLYRRMAGVAPPVSGRVPNPYFAGPSPLDSAAPFSHERQDIYLVTRLDGFTVEDVIGLIDRGRSPSRAGRIVLDEKAAWSDIGNTWLRSAAERLTAAGLGDRVVHEATGQVVTKQSGVLGYYSWGSNDPAIRLRHFDMQFEPGALAGMFVSTDGRTFREPAPEWQVSDWTHRDRFFQGSPQSLAGDLIRDGVTGVAAHVSEPFLDATVRPEILFPAYLAGSNLAEAYYRAMPFLSWQTVIVGDPLCAPFRDRPIDSSTLTPAMDPDTELPAWFSVRRLQAMSRGGLNRAALTLAARAEARRARDDEGGWRLFAEQATALEPKLEDLQLGLALADEQHGEHARAGERYRAVLTYSRDNAVALNNLAYLLATRQHVPKEALPLAQRARTLEPRSAVTADTLGWIYHLLGDHQQAMALVTEAARNDPRNAEIRLHMAVVYNATGRAADARQELQAALELDPSLANREEAVDLQSALGAAAR